MFFRVSETQIVKRGRKDENHWVASDILISGVKFTERLTLTAIQRLTSGTAIQRKPELGNSFTSLNNGNILIISHAICALDRHCYAVYA